MRCPVCRAEVGLAPTCRRCKADLGLLVAVEAARGKALARAGRALAEGQWAAAAAAAAEAQQLRAGADSAGLLAAAQLMAGDFAAAWRWYGAGAGGPAKRGGPSGPG
jgi:hypothetical protein